MDTKICTKCGQTKELSEFRTRPDRPSGYRSECKQCQYVMQRKRENTNRFKLRARDNARTATKKGLLENPKLCQGCSEDKPLDRHHPDYSRQYLIRYLCRKCHTRLHSLLGSYRKAI